MGVPEDIELFERNLKELIIKYEQYFLGLEKREPVKLLDEVDKLARRHSTATITNTMLMFRYNSLKSRLVSYKQYWNRTNRMIEEGKYSRDRFKMERHITAEPPVAEKRVESDVDQVFRQYVDACRTCNLPTDKLSKEMISTSLEKHRTAFQDRYQGTDVEFRVIVEDGKPKIKVRPK